MFGLEVGRRDADQCTRDARTPHHYGLTNARKHLQELGAPEPQLLPFDVSKLKSMPNVELNPKDEFWVDSDKLDSP